MNEPKISNQFLIKTVRILFDMVSRGVNQKTGTKLCEDIIMKGEIAQPFIVGAARTFSYSHVVYGKDVDKKRIQVVMTIMIDAVPADEANKIENKDGKKN